MSADLNMGNKLCELGIESVNNFTADNIRNSLFAMKKMKMKTGKTIP